MKFTLDTNVLVRLALSDDLEQQRRASTLLEEAEFVAIGVLALCEMAWVLGRTFGMSRDAIGAAIRRLLGIRNVSINRPAVAAGLALLDAGGDFADGAIEFEGRGLGGEVFASFDQQAVKLLKRADIKTLLLR